MLETDSIENFLTLILVFFNFRVPIFVKFSHSTFLVIINFSSLKLVKHCSIPTNNGRIGLDGYLFLVLFLNPVHSLLIEHDFELRNFGSQFFSFFEFEGYFAIRSLCIQSVSIRKLVYRSN